MKNNKKQKEGIELTDVSSVLSRLYMEKMIDSINMSLFGMPQPVGYRNVKVPVYFKIKIPVIEKDYDNDSEYGTGEFRGLLISLREVNLFRIGMKIEKEPIYKKNKNGEVIKIQRYSKLKGNEKT